MVGLMFHVKQILCETRIVFHVKQILSD